MSLATVRPYFADHHALRVVWILTVAAMAAVQLTMRFRRRPGSQIQDRGSFLVILAGVGGGLAVLAVSQSAGPWVAIRPRGGAFWLGEALCAAGVVVRGWAIHTLGALFTPIVRTSADQPVIDTGPYRFVRHPSYTGLLLFLAGLGFVLGDWIGLAGVLGLSAAALGFRIRVEERALLAALGEPYRSFAATRKRLLPGVW